jgi:hypothetical protein
MVKFELKKHYLVEKPKTGVFTLERDITTIDLVANPAFTNSIILGGNNITATRPNTTYTENLEVMGEVRYPGAIRYNGNNLERWDIDTETWEDLQVTDQYLHCIMNARGWNGINLEKKNIFERIYDYIIQRFSI